jgi:hypothetical protein
MRLLALVAALALVPVSNGSAAAEHPYVFDGGTAAERNEVVQALQASAFDWRVVPVEIVIHIVRGMPSAATPGHIWLDANLLAAGTFAWGVVQHEYAHQVDFLVLDDADRARLRKALGGRSWCSASARQASRACERFASMLAWAYWPSRENCMRPVRRGGERQFRVVLSAVLRSHQ